VIGTGTTQTITAPGSYSLRISSLDGCYSYDTLNIAYSTAGFQITGTSYFCPDSSTELSISGVYTNPMWNSITPSDVIVIDTPGQVSLTAMSSWGCEITLTTLVTEATTPQTAINLTGTQLRAGAGFASYQWYLNGQIIPGATQLNYTPTANGDYSVEITSISGCSNFSPVFTFSSLGIESPEISIILYPNPFNDYITIDGLASDVHVRMLDITGRKVLEQHVVAQSITQINTTLLNNGVYLLMLLDSEGNVLSNTRIVCQH
jgi:hypothetical protein